MKTASATFAKGTQLHNWVFLDLKPRLSWLSAPIAVKPTRCGANTIRRTHSSHGKAGTADAHVSGELMAGRTCQGGTTCMHCRLALARMSRESALPTVTSLRLWYVRGRRLCRGAKSGRCESPCQAWNDTNGPMWAVMPGPVMYFQTFVATGHRPQATGLLLVPCRHAKPYPGRLWVRSRCSIMAHSVGRRPRRANQPHNNGFSPSCRSVLVHPEWERLPRIRSPYPLSLLTVPMGPGLPVGRE